MIEVTTKEYDDIWHWYFLAVHRYGFNYMFHITSCSVIDKRTAIWGR